MDTLSAAPSPSPNEPSLWKWLLRSVGLETWLQQTPAVAPPGREERVFLQLILPSTLR